MKWTNYLVLCLGLSTLIIGSVLFIPGVGDFLESQLLTYLSANAR